MDPALAEPADPVRVRYRPGSGSEPVLGRWSRALSHATAAVGGSKRLFRGRLERSLDQSRRSAACLAISSTHARWFFGDALVMWVDPGQLTHRLLDRVRADGQEIRLAERFLDAGDWRDVVVPAADVAEHRETAELVRYRGEYPMMPSFRAMLDRIQAGGRVRRYRRDLDSEEKLHDYFRYFLALTESIEAHGFRAQASLGGIDVPLGVAVRGRYAGRQRDIGIAVDPGGRLLRFLGGRHRTAIAQALGLPAVPVEVRMVHADWLAEEARRADLQPAEALRNWAARTSLPRQAPAGPDLASRS